MFYPWHSLLIWVRGLRKDALGLVARLLPEDLVRLRLALMCEVLHDIEDLVDNVGEGVMVMIEIRARRRFFGKVDGHRGMKRSVE